MTFRNPFSRNNPKKSAISRTAERDYEREFKKIERLDEDSRKIYKDMRQCTESQTVQSKCETKMAADFCNGPLCRDDETLKPVGEEWLQSAQRLEHLMMELNATSQKAVSEPMKKFCTIFPNVKEAAKKREQTLEEYNKWQAKVDKYSERERTGPNRVKLEQGKKALKAAKDEYEAQHSLLMEDISCLYDSRLAYIEPSFQALIKAQIKYYTEAHKIFTEFSSDLDGNKNELSDQELDQNVLKKLEDIKALTITKDK